MIIEKKKVEYLQVTCLECGKKIQGLTEHEVLHNLSVHSLSKHTKESTGAKNPTTSI